MSVKRAFVCLILLFSLVPCSQAQWFGKKAEAGKLTGQAYNAKKHFKVAKSFLKQNQNFTAACHIVDAMDVKPRSKYMKTLGPIAEKAYEEKLKLSYGYMEQNNYREALTHYRQLEAYLNGLKRFNMNNFATIDMANAIRLASTGVAEEAYQKAERFYKDRAWHDAVTQYREAGRYAENYKDSRDKIASCFYNQGHDNLTESRYRDAAASYVLAHKEVEGYRDAVGRATEIYFRMGQYYLDEKYPRAAWHAFNEALNLTANYKNAVDERDKAFKQASLILGFGTFENKTHNNVGGIAVGDFIFQELNAKLDGRKSRFLQLTNDLSTAQIVANGLVTQVFAKTSGPMSQQKYEIMKWSQPVEYYEGDKKKTRYVPREETIHYNEKTMTREVVFAGTVNLTNKQTREVVFSDQLSDRANDEARWAELLTNSTNLEHMSGHLKALTQASNQLRGEDEMIKQVIGRITDGLASRLLETIDNAPEPSEPRELDLQFDTNIAGP
ncbi:MAG: hypothetical protein QNK37_25855 [Acidobacteriota bacterium]|nr:hypothetical protein [Acidobacteriota bacterium]